MNNTDIGRMPPQAIELEQAVLGALIVEADAIVSVSNILRPEMFYKEEHSVIYQVINKMNSDNLAIDSLMVIQSLMKAEKLEAVGGAYYISGLIEKIALAANIEYHAHVIKEKYIKRETIRISSLVQEKAYIEGIGSEEILSFLNKQIENIYIGSGDDGTKTLSTAIDDVCKDIENNQGETKSIDGFTTDMPCLREKIPFWENGRLIVLAARPAMGKTALGIHEAINATTQGKPTLFFTLEMSYKQMAQRILLRDDSLGRYIFKANDLKNKQWGLLDDSISKCYDHKLYISDSTYTLNGIKNKCKIFKKKHDIGCVVIDYLQLIEGEKNLPREQQVSQISRSCKLLAKELQIPIFLLAQLNRESENRKSEGYLPKMSDLRESGAIEQDADIIIFPHRACYYEEDDERAWIIVAKNRDGETGKAEVRTNNNVTKFYDPYGGVSIPAKSNYEKTIFDDDKPF